MLYVSLYHPTNFVGSACPHAPPTDGGGVGGRMAEVVGDTSGRCVEQALRTEFVQFCNVIYSILMVFVAASGER